MPFVDIYTNIAVFRTMRYIKRSNENSFKIGRELCALFCILYSEFKKNSMFSTDNTWDTFTSVNGFDHMILTRFISGSVDFPKYFSKCNYKILKMDPRRLSSFFRGYYINDINLFSTNINELNSTNKYFVLYDTHYHYLLFIYNYLEARGVHIQLNDTADKYSINEDSDSMCYKLIFEKKNI